MTGRFGSHLVDILFLYSAFVGDEERLDGCDELVDDNMKGNVIALGEMTSGGTGSLSGDLTSRRG